MLFFLGAFSGSDPGWPHSYTTKSSDPTMKCVLIRGENNSGQLPVWRQRAMASGEKGGAGGSASPSQSFQAAWPAPPRAPMAI